MELAVRAGMDPRTVDVGRLEAEVRGFTVTNLYPCSEALRALSQIFLFDPSPYDAQVHFVPRGDDSVATIVEGELLDDDEDVEQTRRADSIQIPRVLHLIYYDVDGGIAPDKQSSERSGDRRATGEISLQSAVLMNSEEAAQAVAVNHKIMIEDQRGELHLSLSDARLEIVPASALVIPVNGVNQRARVIKVETQDGFQEYVLMHDRQSAYRAVVQQIPAATPSDPPSSQPGPTIVVPLDIALLSDSDDNEGLAYYVAVSGLLGAWKGAEVELSYDGGANYVDSSQTSNSAVIGELVGVLPDHPQAYPDETHTVRIRLHTPNAELESFDLAGLLNGNNLAIIGDELVQFGTADEVYDGIWDLSLILRGRKGSATREHAIGEVFVLLDPNQSNVVLIPASATDLGRTLTFRATSFGTSPEAGYVVSMTFAGRTQIEREVGYLMARRDGSDVIVEWQGVGRIGSGAQAMHGARFDGYRVTFDDGSNEDTVDTDNQTVTHDVSGFGSPLTIRVVQLNQLTGAGPEAELVIT